MFSLKLKQTQPKAQGRAEQNKCLTSSKMMFPNMGTGNSVRNLDGHDKTGKFFSVKKMKCSFFEIERALAERDKKNTETNN